MNPHEFVVRSAQATVSAQSIMVDNNASVVSRIAEDHDGGNSLVFLPFPSYAVCISASVSRRLQSFFSAYVAVAAFGVLLFT